MRSSPVEGAFCSVIEGVERSRGGRRSPLIDEVGASRCTIPQVMCRCCPVMRSTNLLRCRVIYRKGYNSDVQF